MAETHQVCLNPLQTNYYYGRNTPSKSNPLKHPITIAEILQVSLNPLKQTFTMAETLQVSLNPLKLLLWQKHSK